MYTIVLSQFIVLALCYDSSFIHISCEYPGNETIEVSPGDNVILPFLICLQMGTQTWVITLEKDGQELVITGNCTHRELYFPCSRYNSKGIAASKYAMKLTESGNTEISIRMMIHSFELTDTERTTCIGPPEIVRSRSWSPVQLVFSLQYVKRIRHASQYLGREKGIFSYPCMWSPRNDGERAQLRFRKDVLYEYENNGTMKKSWRSNIENRLHTSHRH